MSDEAHRIGRGTARIASAAAIRQLIGTVLLGGTAVVVARSLGATKLGFYAGGTAAYYLAGAFTDLGFGTVAAREMAKHPDREAGWLYATMQVQLLWSGLIALALAGLGLAAEGTRGQVMLVLAPAVLAGGLASARQVFTVHYRATPIVVIDVSSAAIQAAAISTLALMHAGVVAIAGALSVVTCVNAMVVALLARRLVGAAPARRGDRWPVLRMAVPLGIASVLASLYFTIDQVLLGWLVPSSQLGEYAAAVRLLSVIVMVPGFVMAAGIPALSRHAEDRLQLSRFAGMLAHWLAVTALPVAVGLLVFAHPAVRFAFGSQYLAADGLLRILMVAAVLTLASNVLGNVLIALSIIRIMVVFNLLTLVVNVVGNLVLAPRYGVVASAWLTVGCELIIVGYGAVAVRHHVSYGVVLSRVWRPAVAAVATGCVGLAVGPSQPAALPLALVTFGALTLVLRAWPSELLPARLIHFSRVVG